MITSHSPAQSVWVRLDTGAKEIRHPIWWRLHTIRKDSMEPLKADERAERPSRKVRRGSSGPGSRKRRRARRNALHRQVASPSLARKARRAEKFNEFWRQRRDRVRATGKELSTRKELDNQPEQMGQFYDFPSVMTTRRRGNETRFPFLGVQTVTREASMGTPSSSRQVERRATSVGIEVPPPPCLTRPSRRKPKKVTQVTNPSPEVSSPPPTVRKFGVAPKDCYCGCGARYGACKQFRKKKR